MSTAITIIAGLAFVLVAMAIDRASIAAALRTARADRDAAVADLARVRVYLADERKITCDCATCAPQIAALALSRVVCHRSSAVTTAAQDAGLTLPRETAGGRRAS